MSYSFEELIKNPVLPIFSPEDEDFDYSSYMDDLLGLGNEKMDIYNLKNEDNLYKKLKGYIIIARRGSSVTHPDNYEGGDWGVEFSDEFIEENFNDFKKLIHENVDEIFQNLSSRWILALLNNFYDIGNDKEKASVLAISTLGEIHRYNGLFLNSLRDTIPDLTYLLEENKLKCMNEGLDQGDDYLALFKRIKHSMTKDTKPLVEGLINRWLGEDDFILNLFNRFHVYDIKNDILDGFGDGSWRD